MYTVVHKPEIQGHRKRADRPSLEVIDHRKKYSDEPYEESYETLRKQRQSLQEAEIQYQKRIRELEKEAAQIAKAQEATQAENKSLKNFLQRGPKVASVKKVKQQNTELQEVINKLHEENKDLVLLINRMEKREEEEWQDAFEETRRRQEERYSVLGPFVAGLNGKKRTITLNDHPSNAVADDYDKAIEKLSKQTKTLLHKFEQMKRAKGSIDFATVMGPTLTTSNINKHRAIADKVNMDLNKYSARLEDLTSKHEKMTEALITSLSPEDKKTRKKISKRQGRPTVSRTDELEKDAYSDSPTLTNARISNPEQNITAKKSDKNKTSATKNTKRSKREEVDSKSTFLTEVPEGKITTNNRNAKSKPKNDRKSDESVVSGRVNAASPNKVKMDENPQEDGSTSIENPTDPRFVNSMRKRKANDNSKVGASINTTEKTKDTYQVKSASSVASKGILKGREGQDSVKKDENVTFQENQNRTKESPSRETKVTSRSREEETWDEQREKMKDTKMSVTRRAGTKSATSVRTKTSQPIKIKSELDNYNEYNSSLNTRDGKRQNRQPHSDRSAQNHRVTKPRSPLVYENALRQISANDVGSKVFPIVKEAFTKKAFELPLNSTRKGPKPTKTENDVNPYSTGRYSHGPEPITDTKQLLTIIEGPDPKQRQVEPNITFGTRHRSNPVSHQDKKPSDSTNKLKLNVTKSDYEDERNRFKSVAKTRESKADVRSAKSSAKSPRTFPKHPPIHKDSIHLEKAPNSKTVLRYLKQNTGGSPMGFNERYMDKEEKLASPMPVMFRDDARTLGRQNIRFVTRADQPEADIRREQYYRSYLNET